MSPRLIDSLREAACATAGLELLLLFGSRARADQFSLEAVRFWCDAAPVLERGYDDVLMDLKP